MNGNRKASILLLFRDGKATDMQTLYQALGLQRPGKVRQISTSSITLSSYVRELIDARLLKADKKDLETAKISVTGLVPKIQTALDVSLTFIASYDPYQSMVVSPLFGVPGTLVERLDVFVLMPFKHDMLPVYEDHIKPTCASMELTVRRADDFFTADSVVKDVWKAIAGARLIVADCTDRNPNVFYEIGLAHAIGKPTILLTQRQEDVPFDLRHWRYICLPAHTARNERV